MSVLDKFRLDSRVAIVTGGSKGIGEACAQAIAEAGASVVVTSRHLDECAATAQRLASETGATILPLQSDVSKPDDVDAMRDEVLARFGRIDILVNNAGVASRKGLTDLEVEEWQNVIDINLTGPMLCMRAVLPTMIEARYGRIVNISSAFGVVAYGKRPAYTASKAGLINLTRDTAIEFSPMGVTANIICPGLFETPLNNLQTIGQETYDKFSAFAPIGRWGDLSELTPAVVFLASEAASYMVGATLTVDGGWTVI